MKTEVKDYLGYENQRNMTNAQIYRELFKRAFGQDAQIFVGHHIEVMYNDDYGTAREVPSADTALFDHDIMKRVFGARALGLMVRLASVPCEQREAMLAEAMEMDNDRYVAPKHVGAIFQEERCSPSNEAVASLADPDDGPGRDIVDVT